MAAVAPLRRSASRHVRRISLLLLTVTLSVALINNFVYQLIRSPENIGTAQMIDGWARLYKPMIYDDVRPEIVSFGFSWVRDLFDPPRMEVLTGQAFFNFGMSGATSFESYRLIQNALAVHTPKTALLDLRSFYDTPREHLMEAQFDERILHVNRDGSPNSSAAFYRFVKINTSGAALAFNYRFLRTKWRLTSGEAREAILESYERRDWSKASRRIEATRQLISEPRAFGAETDPRIRGSLTYNDLEASMRLLCSKGVDVKLFEAPITCGYNMSQTLQALTMVREVASSCKSKISFHVFRYPNAVTLEGLAENPGLSLFYRPDNHPRPPMGELIATRMLGLEDLPGSPPLPGDFGADVSAMADAEARSWILDRGKRCYGQWEEGALEATMRDLESLRANWAAYFEGGAAGQPLKSEAMYQPSSQTASTSGLPQPTTNGQAEPGLDSYKR
jgi:hypothetical protein